MASGNTRIEHDLLGDKAVPADAYYGVQTARALENFHISGVELRLYPNLIRAFGMVKLAAARANFECGQFSAEILKGIEGACGEVMDGKLDGEFRIDVFQGGAGTSTNMNANEVIANRALELMGHAKGDYKYCSPHDHVNGSQSTNDAYPTALHVGMALGNVELMASMKDLIAAFRAKGKEFSNIVKMGRTQLQDAVPMTLGQEFESFAETLAGEIRALSVVQNVLCEINMGATAIGTGLNAPEGYAESLHRAPEGDHRFPDPSGGRPDRGHPGHAVLRALLVVHEEPGDQALQGLQRPAPAFLGTAVRLPRDQPAGQAARLVDHAGQGQSGHPRGGQPGLLPRHRQRHDGDHGGRGRPTAAQRLRTGDRRLHLRGADHVHERGPHAARPLRRRHHRQRGRLRPLRRTTASAP